MTNIACFVMGSSGKLMKKDFQRADEMEKGFDSDQGFMLIEISGDQLFFQTISRQRQTIDSGVVARQSLKPQTNVAAQ